MTTQETAASELKQKSLTELLEGMPKMLSSTNMQLMVVGLTPLALKGIKSENPELYYSTKARLRDFHAEALRSIGDMGKHIAELE